MQFDALFRQVIENTTDIVVVCDTTPPEKGGPRIVYVNPAFEARMGYSTQEVIGASPDILNGRGTDRQTRYRIRKAMRNGKGIRTELLKYNKQGQGYWMDINLIPLMDKNGEVTHFASIERDLTRYKRMETQLINLALFDSLTGALSRPAFMEQSTKELSRSMRFHRPLSVMMIDIDHFKAINDNYGHAAGDNVLQIFVEAIQEVIRSTDFLGRVGGEEFALLLPDTSAPAAAHLAERIRERITRYPYLAGDMLIEVTASLGVAEFQSEDRDIKTLLNRADEALYQAKQSGRNRVNIAA
ncbi:MAG: diguanylate cyclase [Thioalkalispiraceae bacterium]|jgi:diguanylate cyclase (GGDEF)-like protein/PAS domain S-box-containing protein